MPLRQVFPDPSDKSVKASDFKVELVERTSESPLPPLLAKTPSTNFARSIIAVHGLNPRSKNEADHAWDTWRTPSGSEGHLWLREDLPAIVPGARIFLYQYDAAAAYGTDKGNFHDKASSLLEAIHIKRNGAEQRPILWFGHSMGGILIKQALINAHVNPVYSSIKDATSGLAFFATPQSGGDQTLVNLGRIAVAIANTVGFSNKSDVLSTLKKGSVFSDIMAEQWRHQLESYDIVSFWGDHDTAVPRESARLGLAGNREHIVKLNADHGGVCKFSDSIEDQDNLELVLPNIQKLYEKAMTKSPIPLADDYLRNKSYAKSLKLKRLSGESLDIEDCYINLAIVETASSNSQGRSGAEHNQSSSPYLLEKLAVEPRDAKVDLRKIFDLRKTPDGRNILPRRVFVRGHAGVGKTTLCKKAVHEFLYNRVWSNLFQRVLWVPLRNLQQRGSRYNLFELLSDEFFPHHPQREELAASVQRACQSPGGGQTLFILDGLDEISHLLSGDSDMSRFVTHLLNQPNVIVMSRPSASPPLEVKPFDLEVETLGFEPAQVEEFVRKVEPTNAEAILSFLRGLPLIRDLVRIPIQLDALCFGWDEIYHCKNEPETMTDLYQAIERGLWKKDSHRLKLVPSGLTTDEHRAIGAMASVSKEVFFLEGLAFSGMYNNTILFNANFRDSVAAHFYQPEMTADGILRKTSFMRTTLETDPEATQRHPVYHFVHLTYQEYFAAKYFVRNWQKGTSLKLLRTHQTRTLRDGQLEVKDLTPKQFLHSHKYSARYDIFWRFVAGCLASEASQPKGRIEFFRELDEEPRDYLGVAHQRLIMHCLREIPSTITPSHFIPLKSQIEDEVCTWLVYKPKDFYGLEFGQYPLFAHERDCPSGVFSKLFAKRKSYHAWNNPTRLLANCSFQTRQAAVLALSNQSRLPDNTLHSLVDRLDREGRERDIAAITIQSQPDLPSSILAELATYLNKPDQETQKAAILSLGYQPWPDDILMTVMTYLQSPDSTMQLAALDALARQSSLPEDKLLSIQGFLESQEEYVRDAAFTVIGSQKKLSDCILSAIAAAFIDNRDGPGYGGALEILGNQSTLPLDIIRSLVNSVEFQHMDMKRNVFEVLSKQSNLPEDILRVFLAHLASPLTGTRKPAIVAIRNQPELPPSIYDGILSLLEKSDQWCRWAAASALGGKGVLPKQARLRLRERLDDAEAIVREAATLSLGRQSGLSNDDLWRIVKNLEDGEHDVRQAAALVLRNYPNLPNTILQYVKSLLEDEESYVRHAAVQALGGHPNLSQDLLLSIVERTSDEDRGVVASAMAALGGQATLSEETLRLLIKNLQNSGRCKDVRQGAISILNNSPANASIKLSELSTFPLLMKQDAFRVGATSSDNVDLRETFMSLLIQCSESHLAWYIHEGKSCIETRSGVQRLALENEERFRRAIEAHRKLFRMPEIRTGKVTLFSNTLLAEISLLARYSALP